MARRQKKYHYIYKTTNILNGRYYIGMHSTDDLNDGYMGSGTRLRRSLNKHGKENHKIEYLEFLDSREELKDREAEIVNLNEIAKEECMNLKVGGYGGLSGEEHGRIFSKAGNDKLRELLNNDPEFSKRRSDAISKSLKESYANGTKLKNYGNKAFTGRVHTEETKSKIGKTNSIKQSGERNSQYGTCWITKGDYNKKVKRSDLDSYLNTGWVKGRKIK